MLTPQEERRNTLWRWEDEGKITITGKVTPCNICVGVGDVWFEERDVDFPSEFLFAQIALAVQAGYGVE